jgi:hypothetical protein
MAMSGQNGKSHNGKGLFRPWQPICAILRLRKSYTMVKGSAITLTYTAGITALLMLIFPKFNDDLQLIWYNLSNGGTLGIAFSFINPDNFFPIFLGICGITTGGLLWWHNRPN